MNDILARIAAYKRQEIEKARARVPLDDLEMQAFAEVKPRDFVGAIRASHAAGRPAIIAEIKKASPSKGLIREVFDPPALAASYAAGGATCLSVLTDEPSFQGRPEHLRQARAACRLPVLRKDFMFDPYQVFEARALGADCILVIMAAVTDDEAHALIGTAEALAMNALIEVHDERELDRALRLDPAMVGINNRDLRTFETKLEISERLAPGVPDDCIIVAESGIASAEDIDRLGACGIRTFLVGESLMRQEDVAEATRRLLVPVPAAVA